MKRHTDILLATLLFAALVFYILPLLFDPAREIYNRFISPICDTPDPLNKRQQDLIQLMKLQRKQQVSNDLERRVEQLNLRLSQLETDLGLKKDRYTPLNGTPAIISHRHPLTWNTQFHIKFPPQSAVSPGDSVISQGVLIGRIVSVEGNSAQVHTLLHKNTRISAQLRGTAHNCLIEGGVDSRNQLILAHHFPRDIQLKPGDIFVSSGYGELPGGLPLGKLTYFQRGEINQTLTLKLPINLEQVRYCLILSAEEI